MFSHGKRLGTAASDLAQPAPISSLPGTSSPKLAMPKRRRRSARFGDFHRNLHIDGRIVEIGPLDQPVAAKSKGYRTLNVDKFGQEILRERFSYLGAEKLEAIESVDVVWNDGPLHGCFQTQAHGTFDAVIFSHVLEHVPDPVAFLGSVETLLRDGGMALVSVPDKRNCFDFFRPQTNSAGWIEAHFAKDAIHTKRTMFEYRSSAVAKNALISWETRDFDVRDATYCGMSLQEAARSTFFDERYGRSGYEDCHAWSFTPSSLTLLLNEVHALGLVKLVPVEILDFGSWEFFVVLVKGDRRPINHHERMHLMASAAKEHCEGFRRLRLSRSGGVGRLRSALDAFARLRPRSG